MEKMRVGSFHALETFSVMASIGVNHYFGGAKIFAQMGKAFAEAILNLQK